MKKSRRPVRSHLPDDIVTEILSRLPADDVLEFRRVCRKWKDLVSTQHFANMHLKNTSFPGILVSHRKKLFLVDKWEPPRKRARNRKLRLNSILSPSDSGSWSFYSSHGGLIVFRCYSFAHPYKDFIIFNPITRDKVRLVPPIPVGDIWCIFFHPLIKEYCIIWRSLAIGSEVQYKMLNLGPQQFCKDLNPPGSSVNWPRLRSNAPLFIEEDETLYWMVVCNWFHEEGSCEELIMAFDIKAEQFTLMPHPGPRDDCNRVKHEQMDILKMDGRLSFVRSTTTTDAFIFDVWSLKDSATRLWIQSHSVPINIDLLGDIGVRDRCFRVMAAVSGELLLRYKYGGGELYDRAGMHRVCACNLGAGTVRRIGRTYKNCCKSTFVPTFVSLRNCKSEIQI